MMTMADAPTKLFYTIREAAEVLRVAPSTLYRAIREEAFPAVAVRSRYVVPAKVISALAEEAAETGQLVDVAAMAAERKQEREMRRLHPEWT
jgi:excisionase family DNA binding protein